MVIFFLKELLKKRAGAYMRPPTFPPQHYHHLLLEFAKVASVHNKVNLNKAILQKQ